MEKTKLLLLFIVFCFLFCIECNTSDTGKITIVGTFNLTSDDLTIVPYTGNETLIYKDSIGDSVVYSNGSRTLTENCEACDHLPYPDSSPNCYYYNLSETKFNFPFFYIDLYPKYNYNTEQVIKIFDIQVGTSSIGGVSGSCMFDQGKLFYNNINPAQTNNLNVNYYDSIKLINKYFYSVYELTGSDWCCTSIDDTMKVLYYSPIKGVVGFWTNKHKNWYLDKLIN